jgi:hypothetical protein
MEKRRVLYPRPRDLEVEEMLATQDTLPRAFWLYLAAMALIAAGYADFNLISFHLPTLPGRAVSTVTTPRRRQSFSPYRRPVPDGTWDALASAP